MLDFLISNQHAIEADMTSMTNYVNTGQCVETPQSQPSEDVANIFHRVDSDLCLLLISCHCSALPVPSLCIQCPP